MRILLIPAAAVLTMLAAPAAYAGCGTGAVVGGVAGHMAGHGVLGAAAGCAVGHEHSKNTAARRNAAQPANASGNQPANNQGGGGNQPQ